MLFYDITGASDALVVSDHQQGSAISSLISVKDRSLFSSPTVTLTAMVRIYDNDGVNQKDVTVELPSLDIGCLAHLNMQPRFSPSVLVFG